MPVLELLARHHDREAFDCEVEPLNTYLRQYAFQSQKKKIVRNYVIAEGNKVLAYYSLAFGGVSPEQLPKGERCGYYDIPIMLIARLAVDKTEKGKGYGHAMLKDAALRGLAAAEQAGLKALFVHAKNEQAKAFYQHYGFIESPADPLHLFFPLDAA